MVLYHDKPSKLSILAGKVSATGNCTSVIGGKMTCGSWDIDGSSLITWAPAFANTPIILGTVNSGAKTITSPAVRFTAIGVSNASIVLGATDSPGQTIGLIVLGEARL